MITTQETKPLSHLKRRYHFEISSTTTYDFPDNTPENPGLLNNWFNKQENKESRKEGCFNFFTFQPIYFERKERGREGRKEGRRKGGRERKKE
jgi:hypothetical protein